MRRLSSDSIRARVPVASHRAVGRKGILLTFVPSKGGRRRQKKFWETEGWIPDQVGDDSQRQIPVGWTPVFTGVTIQHRMEKKSHSAFHRHSFHRRQ